MPNHGNPTVLNDVGNDMMTRSQRLIENTGRIGEHAAIDEASLGRAGEGVGLPGVYDEAVEALVEAMEFLATTLEDDGYHLQRASLELDRAMNNTCAPPTPPGPGPV